MVLCVAIFNKDNSLLCLRVKESHQKLEQDLQMFLYCSCDIINEKAKLTLNKSAQEHFLGSLLLNNSFRSFGYLSNTNVKFIIVTDTQNTLLRDNDIRAIFKKLHLSYCHAIANPFYVYPSKIHSRFIDRTMSEIFDM